MRVRTPDFMSEIFKIKIQSRLTETLPLKSLLVFCLFLFFFLPLKLFSALTRERVFRSPLSYHTLYNWLIPSTGGASYRLLPSTSTYFRVLLLNRIGVSKISDAKQKKNKKKLGRTLFAFPPPPLHFDFPKKFTWTQRVLKSWLPDKRGTYLKSKEAKNLYEWK